MNAMLNPRRDARFWLHRKHLQDAVEISSAIGLEIGAFDLPSVMNDEGSCQVADYRSTDELMAHARLSAGHSPEFVHPVDYDLRKGYGSISKEFNYIVAAHVIEHVPNLVTWLADLSRILTSNGAVFVVVPDKRYTFDAYRKTTNLSDVFEAYHAKTERPTPRQAFDSHYYLSHIPNISQIWDGTALPLPPRRNFTEALMLADIAASQYQDVHCWVFTPESFAELFSELRQAGLINFMIESMRPTTVNHADFSVVLRKV